jgi:hypothetical protein
LATEKLRTKHGIELAKETVRRLQIAVSLWIPRKLRPPKIDQPRMRRACLGELVQIGGCDHHWFEDRGPSCTALVYTPAAKGRVERAHGTLQDRLVKEMRLEGISSIADANAWIDGFVEGYNMRFSKPPAVPINVHRPMMDFEDLERVFTWQEARTLSASLTLQYDKVFVSDRSLTREPEIGR